mgnify:CR=1 FL=1
MANQITKTHADWLSLIEISGPFVSMPILSEVFPQGLDDVPAELARSLRADFEFWQESAGDVAVHSAWVRLVLESLLNYSSEVLLSGQAIPAGLKAEFPEHEETVRPDFVLAEPSAGSGERKPKLLIQVFPPTQDLGKAVSGSRWAASVGTRMMELLHATEIRLGLVTNGEQWMLVDAPRGETTGFTTWYASLWFDERSTLNAFQSLLGVRRFFGVAEDETLESLLARSADHQQEVTDQLGLQVRHAVEILIQAVDKAEQNRGAKTSRIAPELLYEAALTVMMRLVFLLSAEERKLLPIDDDQYSNYYAVSTLREQLQTLASDLGEEVLERRFDAWSRLLAVFRAVHGGIRHQELNLPAYGGSLFDPDRFPFLEGRGKGEERGKKKEVPLAIDNRTVLHLLDALQLLRVDGEMRRLSFRALDVEQIGHVYEGLLDHKAVRAVEVMLGLGGAKRLEPEMALSKLEQERVKGEASFVAWLKDETQKSPAALKNALAIDIQKDALKLSRLRSACGNDDALLGRILPFAGLIRMDDFGNPAVILPGSVYVTAGTSRRATGSHYTPRSLTEPIVQHTLEPLVYAGVAEGLPREEWKLRSAAELLDLKICDMAMGSAGFLVQVVRYLAERLVESWQVEKLEGSSAQSFKPENVSMTDEDLLNYARRLVAERCIYGVDKNPLAVEIAKLSLWLVTLAKEKPFTFLDHALKCGDALVGTSAEDFLRWANRKRTAEMSLDQEVLREELDKARGLRKQLESFVALDVRDAERKSALLVEADAAMEHVKRGADLLAGVKLLGLNAQDAEDLQLRMVDSFLAGQLDGAIDADKHPDPASALSAAKKERAFHWEFEYPEVFERGGFSAFVGNPPFLWGMRISTTFGQNYYSYITSSIERSVGAADYCAYFLRRAVDLLRKEGSLGLITVDTIAQGDTREIGLDEITKDNNNVIFNAVSSQFWPGTANVKVSRVHLYKGEWYGYRLLDNLQVSRISSRLLEETEDTLPYSLSRNAGKSFVGHYLMGQGFVLSAEEEKNLLATEPAAKKIIFDYLRGEDINQRPDQKTLERVINFGTTPLEECEKKYPATLSRIRKLVKPERDLQKRKANREKWWQYAETRPGLTLLISQREVLLAQPFTTKYIAPCFVNANQVFASPLVIIDVSTFDKYAVLQSNFHDSWVRKYSSKMGDRVRYASSDCFENFPFPMNFEGLEKIGETYYEHRRQIMLSRQEGLTTTYNRFHKPEEGAGDIVRLRELHVEMDKAVASAYGWEDLSLGHDFHETAQGVRFTVSESARREVLSRLLKLNHERWEEEQKAAGEAQKAEGGKPKKVKKKAKPKSTDGQMGLL